ncbi:MAG: hypothetical protein U9R42_12775 [Bacteroidota bacterium]|nr:hypothetical protein [Bacteroidota bacterium]
MVSLILKHFLEEHQTVPDYDNVGKNQRERTSVDDGINIIE